MSNTESQTATPITPSQDEIDRQEMIAGTEMGRALLEIAMNSPGVDAKKLQNDVITLMIPSRYKDISAKDLRSMVKEKYVLEVSMMMMKDLNVTKHKVPIQPNHFHIVPDLVEHWQKQGYHVSCSNVSTTDEDGNLLIRVTSVTIEW